jgi:hypothetical protein
MAASNKGDAQKVQYAALLDIREAREKDDDDEIDKGLIWQMQQVWQKAPKRFKNALRISSQVSLWMTIFLTVGVSYGRNRINNTELFDHFMLNLATVGCNVLFILSSTVGGTIGNCVGGIKGIFWAWCVMWGLLEVYPQGVKCQWRFLNATALPEPKHIEHEGGVLKFSGPCEDSDYSAWWACLVVSTGFFAFFLIANVDDKVRFFALISYVGWAMTFINPEMAIGASFDNKLFLYAISAVIAIAVMLLPPKLATADLRKHIRDLEAMLGSVKSHLCEYYMHDCPTLEIHFLHGDVHTLMKDLKEARALVVASWYESFGGLFNFWHLTNTMFEQLDEIITEFVPIIELALREEFGKRHKQIMAEIAAPLIKYTSSMQDLMRLCLNASFDGKLLLKEKTEIEVKLNELDGNLRTMQIAMAKALWDLRQSGSDDRIVCPAVAGEQCLAYTSHRGAETLKAVANKLINNELKVNSWQQGLKEYYSNFFSIDKKSLKWAVRIMISLCLAFCIGTHGYCNCAESKMEPGEVSGDGQCACFLDRFNAGIPSAVVIFMGHPAAQASLGAALDRIAAVVLATLAGQLVYVLCGWPTVEFKIATVVLVFFGMGGFVYVANSGGSNASIGTRLAATVMSFACMAGSTKTATYKSYSDDFHGLYNIVFGIGLITIADLIFGDEPESTRATAILKPALKAFLELLTKYFREPGCMDLAECKKQVDKIREDISAASALSDSAAAEPTLWRPRWRPVAFEVVCSTFIDACTQLSNLASLFETMKESISTDDTAWKSIGDELINSTRMTIKLSRAILNYSRDDDAEQKKALKDLLKRDSGRYERSNFAAALEAFSDEINGKLKVSEGKQADDGITHRRLSSSEADMAMKFNSIVVNVESMMRTLNEGRTNVVSCKNV